MIGSVLLGVFLLVLGITLFAGPKEVPLSKDFPWQFRLMAKLRTPILMFIVVPMSFALWVYEVVRDTIRHTQQAADHASPEAHRKRAQVVVDSVKRWIKEGRKNKLRTARPNWAAMSTKLSSNKAGSHMIPMSHLNHILEVNEDNMTITVEPCVTFGQIAHRLYPHNFALAVHVEMESITVAGAVCGFGMETNSHVEGFFQETIVAFEIVTPDGKLRTVDKDSDPELFRAQPWSYGTMGFLTSVTVRMRKTKPYVHVTYIPTKSPKELCEKMKSFAESDNPPMFLEATIYDKNNAVLQCGNFADEPKDSANRAKINAINWWWKPFYYKWVETFIKKGGGDEYIPLKHYYHRFTRSIFWELEDMIPFSNHPIYRTLWGWMGAPRVALLKLFQGPVIRKASVYAHVVQESIMPIRHLATGIEKFDKWYGVYPLLVFPLRVYDRGDLSGMLHPRKDNLIPGKNYGIWVDLGAYGAPRAIKQGKNWDAKRNIREMEHWTRDLGGWQALYTDVMCTEKELRQMFDHTLLDKVRKRLGAVDAFPAVYDKIKPEPGIVDLSDVLESEQKTNGVHGA